MENKAQKLLESLTPGGSEFFDDPEYCVKNIREHRQSQHEIIVKLVIEKKSLIASERELISVLKEAKEVLLQLDHRHNGKCYNPASENCDCTICKITKVLIDK
jgi:hypothetical protein